MFHDNNNAAKTKDEELAEVLALLAREPLCPDFLARIYDEPGDRPFETTARVAVRNPNWGRGASKAVPEWIDGDPIYPESPDAVGFFGNFSTVSRVFNFDTDEPDVIEQMRKAIAANLASEAFKAAQAVRAGGAP